MIFTGWYISWVFRWMQETGNTNIKAYWDYTDTNDVDMGCSFVYTIIEGLYFSAFGISVIAMKALNAIEAIILCSLMYLYIRKENRLLGLITVICLIGWNMFHTHFFNRPELLASIIAIWALYMLNYQGYSRRSFFMSYFLLGILLDIHPLSLFLVVAAAVWSFIKFSKKRLIAIAGFIAGMLLYFIGNYLVNDSYGIFTGLITGQQMALGDHYIPIISTGFKDILQLTLERFTFLYKVNTAGNIVKLLAFSSVLAVTIYGIYTKKLTKTRLLKNSALIYFSFILLSSLFSEAVSNGFRLYHAIAFGLFYFALLYSIYYTAPIRYIAFIGLVPFLIFIKDSIPQIKLNYQYHDQNKYYRQFQAFNDNIPENSKVLMRPTHAFFTFNKSITFNYTYGLLRYMNKKGLSFQDAIIEKDYNYIALDEQFETEFFIDMPSSIRTSPSPYYSPLRHTGLTSTDFNKLISEGFLTPVANIYDAFAGNTILYKVNN